MQTILGVYGESLALLTDLYQQTMAYGYWKSGLADREAVFHLSMLHDSVKRFDNPHIYPVGLDKGLHDLKTQWVLKTRGVVA